MCVGENYARVCILAKWAKVQIYHPSLGRLEYRNSFSMPFFLLMPPFYIHLQSY